jgi:hypothetical protein
MELPHTQPTDNGLPPQPGGLILSPDNTTGITKQQQEVELATMREMLEALFSRIETLQQNQAVQFAGVHDRLDAVELELPLIQEQSALRIRDLESRMGVEIEEAARIAVEELTSGLQEEVTGRFGSLMAQMENQRKELLQMRDAKKIAENKLNRAVLDIERLCGSFASHPVEDPPRFVPERPLVSERPAADTQASPYRSRVSEYIRKAAVEAVPDDSNPLIGDPGQPKADSKLEVRPHHTSVGGTRAPGTSPAHPKSADVTKPNLPEGVVPGFDDWKRQFMQDGEPLKPTLVSEGVGNTRLVVCPRCYSERTRPATRNRLDGILLLAGFTPHRCRSCAHRFYKRGSVDAHAYDESSETHSEDTVETR